jgi:hypothetical protein
MRLIYLQIFLLTIGTAFSQNNCDRYKDKDEYVPKDLNDALNYLNCTWPPKDKEEFKSKDEREAVSELHMGKGQGIRNGWGLWEGKNSLYRSFKSKGISHPDDISSIILTSFHRQLNNKDIGLEEQIREYQDYWDKAKAKWTIEANKKKQTDKEEFKKFNLGDTVSMRFAKGNCKQCLILYPIQTKSIPDRESEKTCIVKGIVRGKRVIKKYNYILVIESIDICGERMAYYGDGEKDNLIVGNKFKYNISHNNITRE